MKGENNNQAIRPGYLKDRVRNIPFKAPRPDYLQDRLLPADQKPKEEVVNADESESQG